MQPSLSLQVSIPVRMDGGRLKAFPAWRAHYNTSLGPAKGGVRFHPNVNQHEVTTLSFWMAVKCAVVGLPYGGGKGGVQVDAKALSSLERERLARGYIRAIADIMGPDRDIPAPDVNADATVMGWMIDEYEQITRAKAPAAKVLTRAQAEGITYRQGAYRQGIERIAEAITVRGNCQDSR